MVRSAAKASGKEGTPRPTVMPQAVTTTRAVSSEGVLLVLLRTGVVLIRTSALYTRLARR